MKHTFVENIILMEVLSTTPTDIIRSWFKSSYLGAHLLREEGDKKLKKEGKLDRTPLIYLSP